MAIPTYEDLMLPLLKRMAAAPAEIDLRGFVGSLVGNRASKGVFVTASKFTTDAREYARNVQHRVVLIDGAELVRADGPPWRRGDWPCASDGADLCKVITLP